MTPQVQHFAKSATRFCKWAESTPGDPVSEARIAFKTLAELILVSTELPDFFGKKDSVEIPDHEYRQIYNRFKALPFQHYSQCFNPFQTPPEEPVTADIADDLADIWRDLKRGLALYNSGHPEAAVWEWRFHFTTHWGHHATGALYALHTWLSQNGNTV